MRIYADHIDYFVELHQSNRELPYLLMLHGFMGSGRSFKHLINPLKSFCNPITIDLAGHGQTVTPTVNELFSTDRQVTQIKSVINRLSFENLFIYGYSMGGRLTFQLICDIDIHIKGAVIESSHCGIADQNDRRKRVLTDQKRASSIQNDFNQFLNDWKKLTIFSGDDSSINDEYHQIMKNQNPDLMALSLKEFGAGVMPNVCEKLQNLPLPLYLVAGKDDIKYAELTPEISTLCNGCNYSVVEGAGHRVHVDRPEKLISIIKTFIKENYV